MVEGEFPTTVGTICSYQGQTSHDEGSGPEVDAATAEFSRIAHDETLDDLCYQRLPDQSTALGNVCIQFDIQKGFSHVSSAISLIN